MIGSSHFAVRVFQCSQKSLLRSRNTYNVFSLYLLTSSNFFRLFTTRQSVTSIMEDDRKRSREASQSNKGKKAKNEVTQSRRGFDFDVNVDERERPPHEGSFANPKLREQYGVSLEPRTVIGDDQKTLKRKVALFL
jgi:hypothetical protein